MDKIRYGQDNDGNPWHIVDGQGRTYCQQRVMVLKVVKKKPDTMLCSKCVHEQHARRVIQSGGRMDDQEGKRKSMISAWTGKNLSG